MAYLDSISVDNNAYPLLGISGDRYYPGFDLSQKFSDEIGNTDIWTWIRQRIRAADTDGFNGLHVNDFIPFTTSNSVSLKACIGGMNTYRNYGDSAVGNHIDFICRELWPTLKPINPVNYNNGLIPAESVVADGTTTAYTLTKQMSGISSITMNGTGLTGYSYDAATYTITFETAPAAGTMTVTGTGSEHSWLSCDLYHWLNSLAGQIPNSTDLNPAVLHVDYTADGVYKYLPAALKAAIVEKRFQLDKRYSASGVLSTPNSWGWANLGKLWLPTECEVYGAPVWGGAGYASGGAAVQYPIFAGNTNRVKYRSGSRNTWWLLTPYSGGTTSWCLVASYGYATNSAASVTFVAAPVCFRIS